MFDGDCSGAGRAERLARVRASKEFHTEKVGGARGPRENQTAVPNSIFGGSSGEESAGIPQNTARQDGAYFDTRANSGNFQERTTAKSTSYDIEMTSAFPIIDMMQNAKRHGIMWVADANGERDACFVAVPQGYDLAGASLTNEDFANGKCSVSIPAVQRNVLMG